MFSVYVLYSDKINKFYTGYTSNLKKRLLHHNLGLDRWSKRGIPWKIVYEEEFLDKTKAIRREKFLKTGKGRDLIRGRIAKVVTARV